VEPILEVKALSKSFKKFKVVDDLSFSIGQGEVYGFLGQNGAGKSTTMRMLLGLIFPDSGTIYINGTEFNNQRRDLLKNIGAIIERPDMYGYLSAWENLRIFAALSDKHIKPARLHEVIEIVGLKGREKDKVKAYSQGMKQRLGIAIAMVHKPDLLILDEPTNGLDPQGIAEIRELIKSLSKEHGKTVLVSSHLLHEVEQVASNVIIIHKGKKIAEAPLSELLHPDETLIDITTQPKDGLKQLISSSDWARYSVQADAAKLTFKMNPSRIPELNKWLIAKDVAVIGINTQHSFESYFLNITNETTAADRAV
jgi:ABC-type multidrug transport system ATPase subunit